MASGPGILYVESRILDPERLSEGAFDEWYEEEHALEVLRLPGVPSGVRYKALASTSSTNDSTNDNANDNGDEIETQAPHLITYEFPSLAYASNADFRAITETEIPPQLVERIYKNVRFDIRFYAEVPAVSTPTSTTSSPTASSTPSSTSSTPTSTSSALVSISLPPPSTDNTTPFHTFLSHDLPSSLSRIPGFLSLRRFEYVSRVLIDANQVKLPEKGGNLVLVAFEGVDEGARRSVEEAVRGWGARVGWFGVRRVWGVGDVEKV